MALPGIDGVCDYDSPYRSYADEDTPELECEYIIYWQSNGVIHQEFFSIYSDYYEHEQLIKAINFAREHDTLLMYREPDHAYFNSKTGEEIYTPDCGVYCKDYYDQPQQPYENIFTAIETDELPF